MQQQQEILLGLQEIQDCLNQNEFQTVATS